MSRNGGYDRYRATLADENAWTRARRPKYCKLANSPRLRQAVAGKLRLGWAPGKKAVVAKIFLGGGTKILRAADASSARRREGPYRFIQNRKRTSVVALKSDAAAEKSKDQLSRNFRCR